MRNYGIAPGAEWTPERIAAVTRNTLVVVAGGIVLGIFAVAASAYYVVFVVAVAALVMLIAWRFEVALLIYALVAFIPWGKTPDIAVGGSGVGKGLYVSEAMLGFLLAIWFARYLLHGLPKNRISSGFYLPIALYIAYSILNVTNSFIFWDWHVNRRYQFPMVNFVEIGLHALSVAALLMMATSISSRKWLNWVTVALLGACCFNFLNRLLGGVVHIVPCWSELLYFLPACYAWVVVLDRRHNPIVRGISLAWVAVTIYILLIQGLSWVSGWLGLLAALGTIALVRSKRLFFALAVIACVTCVVEWPFLYKNVVQGSQAEGDYDRFAMMRGALMYATEFPLGVGLGNYRTYNSFYYGEKWGTTSYTSAHGTYSQHLSEMGFPGLVLFVSILISGFRWMWVRYRAMPPGPSKTYLLAAMGQLVGISAAASMGDYIIPTYHNGGVTTFASTVYSWLIWGLAIAHVRLDHTREPEVSND